MHFRKRLPMVGLYIHVPFCLSKCPYCDFYSVKYSRKIATEYAKAVIRNINAYDEKFDTIYFGGGTPVLLWEEICTILSSIKSKIADNTEISIEANPNCTTETALSALFKSGVNRISFGVQSGNENELLQLGRKHSVLQAENAIKSAHKVGFENISADLMLAIPSQTATSLQNSLDFLTSLPVTHISAYLLKIENNTPFADMKLILPDEDQTDKLYLQTVKTLNSKGLKQYEISNFAKEGFECKHNLKYWNCEQYIGIGPSAHSYYNEKRFAVDRDLNEFLLTDVQKTYITEPKPHTFDEWAMLKLRLTSGLVFDECADFGVSKEQLLQQAKLIPSDYLSISDKGISITEKGFLVSNAIISKLLDI